MSNHNDFSSKAGAERMAAALQTSWHQRGHMTVRFWAEIVIHSDVVGASMWGVRSNLVNGCPPEA